MEIDIEFLVNEYLKEHGCTTEVYPIKLGAAVPPSWYIVVKTRPDLMVSVTGGIIRLEVFGSREFLGSWDVAHPTSFDDLVEAIRVYNLTQGYFIRRNCRVAKRKRDRSKGGAVDTKPTYGVGSNFLSRRL